MKKNVLLVEDDPALRMVMREVLKDEFEIDEADNGADGIDKGLHSEADLIILDYHLPKKDGLEVIAAIREQNPDIPVIVLTGYLNPESKERFSDLGANKIFPKPFNYRTLIETVKDLTWQTPPAVDAPQTQVPMPAPLAESGADAAILKESLDTLATLAEKVEFLQSVSEKYWVQPDDIVTIRETARCMQAAIQQYYGKVNHSLFSLGEYDSPIVRQSSKPFFSGNN